MCLDVARSWWLSLYSASVLSSVYLCFFLYICVSRHKSRHSLFSTSTDLNQRLGKFSWSYPSKTVEDRFQGFPPLNVFSINRTTCFVVAKHSFLLCPVQLYFCMCHLHHRRHQTSLWDQMMVTCPCGIIVVIIVITRYVYVIKWWWLVQVAAMNIHIFNSSCSLQRLSVLCCTTSSSSS